jgi:FAD-dependent urate hydroxylase
MKPGRLGRRRRRPDRGPAVVIGAGPNGLAVTAHLRGEGVDTRCFGEPLESWTEQMPVGMLLRSRRRSSHIADPGRSLRIGDYERAEGRTVSQSHLTLEDFVDYGRWFQRQAVPDVDRRKVSEVTRDAGGFSVRLQDGERLTAARVIVAAGLSPFMHCPAPFQSLSPPACSHSGQYGDLSGFTERRVAVIGSGQSALECAALLHEAGADVEVLSRAGSIYWLGDDTAPDVTPPPRRRPSLSISPSPTDVGGRVTGWLAAAPDVFRRLPRRLQPEISYRCIRPAGAGWLRPRLADVTLSCGRQVIEARERDHQVRLRLNDGSIRTVDHVLLGTGYRVDVRRYPFLAPELSAKLRLADGQPELGPGLESSVAGLHFMGAPAAHSFGPIMRFVVGAWYSAPAVACRVAGRRQLPISFSF